MSRSPHRDAPYWVHSDPEPSGAPAGPPAVAHPCGVVLRPDSERPRPCRRDDGTPRPAGDGLGVCLGHERATRDALQLLPDLWAALGDQTRTKPPSLGGRSKPGAALPLGDTAQADRSAIVAVLIWCEQGIQAATGTPITSPDEVRAQTRGLAVDTALELKGAREEARGWDQVSRSIHRWDNGQRRAVTDADRAAARQRAATARRRATELEHRWRGLEDDARTGRDVVAARASRVDRHLTALLSGPDAGDVASRLIDARDHASRTAWPPSTGIRVPCPRCGGRVRLTTGPDGSGEEEITCSGTFPGPDGPEACGEHGVLAWWARQVGASLEPMTEDQARSWLEEVHGIRVADGVIRDWVARGKLPAAREDRDGRTRAVYHPVALLEAATTERERKTRA